MTTHWCVMCPFETEDEAEAYAHDCMSPATAKLIYTTEEL